MSNRKGQVGESMTWIVATVIILVMLMVFVYASSLLSVKTAVVKIKSKYSEIDKTKDWISTKNEMAFSLNSANKALIENWIEEVEKENE